MSADGLCYLRGRQRRVSRPGCPTDGYARFVRYLLAAGGRSMTLACPDCGPTAEVVVTNIDTKPAARDLDFRCGECGREPVVHSHVEGGLRS